MALIAEALRRSGLLGDYGWKDLGDAAASVGSSVLAQVPAGVNGLLKLATTGDPDAAAAEVERSQEALTYQPRTQGGQDLLAGTGRVLAAGGKAAMSVPGARAAQDFVEKGQEQNPLLYALAAGAINVAAPEARGPAAVERAVPNLLRVVAKADDFKPAKLGDYRRALEGAREAMGPQDRLQVSSLPKDFKGKVFLSDDGKSGFGVAKNGELVALFKHPSSPRADVMGAALARGSREGGTHLNAFDTYLAKGYAKRGAVERSRAPFDPNYAPEGWDPVTMGTPDYVTMDLGSPVSDTDVRSSRRKAVEKAARDSGGKVKRSEMVDDEEAVRRRVFQSHKILDEDPRQPLDLLQLRKDSVLDRRLIDDAMEGHPGVAQVPAERPAAMREKTREEIDQRTREIFDDPVNRPLIVQQARNGLRFGGDTYYASSYPLRDALGDPEAFRKDIAAHAGTSAQNPLPNNFASQSIVLAALRDGVDMNDFAAVKAYADRVAAERGHHKYFISPRHVENVMRLIRGEDTGLKIDSYNANLLGNFERATLDTHEAKGSTIGSRHYPHYERAKGFEDTEYGGFETGYRELGNLIGRKPAVFQAGRWYGGGKLTGLKSGTGDWLSTREHMIQYSAEKLGLPTTRSNLRKLLLDSARGDFKLVPYYPTKENPLPQLKGKPEKGFIDPKLAALIAGGAAAGGLLAPYMSNRGEAR